MEKKTFLTFIYGSLRRGQYNCDRFPGFIDGFQKEGFIKGAILKSLGPYPAIIASENENDIVKGELFEVPEDIHRMIHGMEVGAGYEYRPVDVHVEVNGAEAPGKTYPVSARTYFFRDAARIENRPTIATGDWVNQV